MKRALGTALVAIGSGVVILATGVAQTAVIATPTQVKTPAIVISADQPHVVGRPAAQPAAPDGVTVYKVVREGETSGNDAPSKIVVRCDGWAEDSASELILLEIGEGDKIVYRCLTGAEI